MVWVWVLFIFCFILIETTFSFSCPPVRCRVRSNESHRAQVLERFSQADFSLDLSAWAQMKSPLAVPEYLSLLVWGWKEPQNKLSKRNNHIYFHACKKVIVFLYLPIFLLNFCFKLMVKLISRGTAIDILVIIFSSYTCKDYLIVKYEGGFTAF